MAHTQSHLSATEQPVIDDSMWPLRILFDSDSVEISVAGRSKSDTSEWCRTFAAALLAHADAIDESHRLDREALAAAQRDVADMRAAREGARS